MAGFSSGFKKKAALGNRVLAEFLGGFFLLLAALGSLVPGEGLLVPALASGLAILVMVVALGAFPGPTSTRR